MKADTEIQSVNQYKDCLKRYQEVYPNGLYFRGEPDDYPDHKPSLARNEYLLQNEAQVFSRFVSEHSNERADLTIAVLAKIQHYGSMTRLIDLTIDPLVALFFACEKKDDEPGFVFLYIPNGTEKGIESPEARAIALYSSEDVQSAEDLSAKYKNAYGESVDVAACCSHPFIMKYDERLFLNNERMKLQKGAFAVCGADVTKLPERTVILFDFVPTRTFMIPAAFKRTIMKELADMGVQPTTIYPEPYSTLSRIKVELGKPKEEIDLEKCYEVVENSRIRHKIFFKDLEIQIKLLRPLDNDSVKEIIRMETRKYTDKADVVWSYAANSDTDLQMSNWRLRGKWIRKGIDFQSPLRETGSDGFSWNIESGSVLHSLWMQEFGFGDDRVELCKYIKAFNLMQPEIELIREYASGKAEKPVLTWCSKAFKIDVLYACNSAMDGLFQSLGKYFADAAVLNQYIQKEDKQALSLELKHNVLSDEKTITDRLPYWIKELSITDEDIEAAEPFKREQEYGNFKPTIPLGKDPLPVELKVKAYANSKGKVEITGFTNLFDGAELMVELDNKATEKTNVKDGKFYCVLGAPESCHVGENHIITVILPIPGAQPLDFVKKAGMEYENLDSVSIKWEGLGVSGSWNMEVVLE